MYFFFLSFFFLFFFFRIFFFRNLFSFFWEFHSSPFVASLLGRVAFPWSDWTTEKPRQCTRGATAGTPVRISLRKWCQCCTVTRVEMNWNWKQDCAGANWNNNTHLKLLLGNFLWHLKPLRGEVSNRIENAVEWEAYKKTTSFDDGVHRFYGRMFFTLFQKRGCLRLTPSSTKFLNSLANSSAFSSNSSISRKLRLLTMRS